MLIAAFLKFRMLLTDAAKFTTLKSMVFHIQIAPPPPTTMMDLEPTTAPSRSICHCSLASKHNFPNTQAIILNINWTPNYLEINKSELQTANIPVLRPTQHHVMTLCPYKPSTMWLQIQPPSLQNNHHVTYQKVQCIKPKHVAINGTSSTDPLTSNYLQVWSSDIQMTGMMTPAMPQKYLDHFMHQASQANMYHDRSCIGKRGKILGVRIG